jgi:diguanylate cyclase (GGDEF)-like protein/PAS domain S-box-containing protein
MLSSKHQNHNESPVRAWASKVSTTCSHNECGFHEELIQAALQLTTDAIILIDSSSSVVLLNSMAEKITGWKSCDAKFLPISEIFSLDETEKYHAVDKILKNVLTENHQISVNDDLPLNIASIHSALIEYSISPIYRNDQKCTIGAALIFRDVSVSCQLANQLSWQLNHDFLTGLMNRRSFEQSMEIAVSNSKNSSITHALCYLDFDHFKIINETFDHVAGDEFLRQASALIQKRIRKTDALARLGGDEFGLILYQCTLEQALNVLNLLREDIRNFKFIWKSKTFSFNISAGLVMLDSDSKSSSRMIIAADSACNIAKSKGRNRVHVCQAKDREIFAHHSETQWVPRLLRALEDNQFCLYSQPIVQVSPVLNESTKKIHEILIRLKDETGQIVLPLNFIPIAERYGLMHLIDRWVIQNLFNFINQSRRQEINQDRHISNNFYMINLSGASLNDDQFLDFIKEKLDLYSIKPQAICFEITETMAIENLSKTTYLIQQLRTIGCSFALDDFGSGMSSFGYLKNLPVDYLKIDGIFIKDIVQNRVDREIVEAINRVAHVMGIQTVAEYVEDNEILMELKGIGIDYAQGYGIARPAPLQ